MFKKNKSFIRKNTNPQNMKRLDCPIVWDAKSIKKNASGKLTIKGYANTKDRDRVGDVVLPEAFAKQLSEFMENPILLYMHDWDRPCGKVIKAEIDEKGLLIEAEITNAKSAEDIREMVKDGTLKTFSIGYNELDADWDKETATNYVKELELLEISIVTIPCNTQAKFEVKPDDNEEEAEDDSEGKSAPKKVKTSDDVIVELNDTAYDFIVEKINNSINEGKTITKNLMKEFEMEFCSTKKGKVAQTKAVITEDQAEFMSQMLNMMESNEEVDSELIIDISKAYDHLKDNESDLIEK